MSTVRFGLPTPGGNTIEFGEAAKDKRLLIRHCRGCDASSYYPRPFVPHVLERAGGVAPSRVRRRSIRGYTWSVISRNDQPPFCDRVPYVAAVVDLAEGPRMMTNVVECPFEDLRVDTALRLTFEPISEEFTVAVFVPA